MPCLRPFHLVISRPAFEGPVLFCALSRRASSSFSVSTRFAFGSESAIVGLLNMESMVVNGIDGLTFATESTRLYRSIAHGITKVLRNHNNFSNFPIQYPAMRDDGLGGRGRNAREGATEGDGRD